MTRAVLVIGGPTASGKSSLALKCAAHYDGVIINADSMQIYDDLHVLTAHPSLEDHKAFPHQLYGVLKPHEKCSAAMWRDMALKEINAAHQNNKTPIIVGGTGFYIQALLKGLSPMPDISESDRNEAIAFAKEMGNEALYALLKEKDPDTAAKLDPQNTQRLTRAWEVLKVTGRGLASWQSDPLILPPADLSFFYITLLPEREILYDRCNTRFEQMIELGALAEVESFTKKLDDGEIPQTAPLIKALGFSALKAYLKKEATLEEAKSQASQQTRNYAKRQMTWFRNQGTPDLVLQTHDVEKITAQFKI